MSAAATANNEGDAGLPGGNGRHAISVDCCVVRKIAKGESPAAGVTFRADHTDTSEQGPLPDRSSFAPEGNSPHGFAGHQHRGTLPLLIGLRAIDIEQPAAIVLDFERLDRCFE